MNDKHLEVRDLLKAEDVVSRHSKLHFSALKYGLGLGSGVVEDQPTEVAPENHSFGSPVKDHCGVKECQPEADVPGPFDLGLGKKEEAVDFRLRTEVGEEGRGSSEEDEEDEEG